MTDMTVRRFTALASETEDATREPAEGDIYEVEDPENLPEDSKAQDVVLFRNQDSESENQKDEHLPVHVWVAVSNQARHRGLSDHKSLGNDEGMLFDWGEYGPHGLTMRSMSFPIDMVFLDADGRVNKIVDRVGPDEPYTYQAECQYALELPAGFCEDHGVDKGWRVYREQRTTPDVIDLNDEDIVEIDSVHEAPDDVVVQHDEDRGLYYEKLHDSISEKRNVDGVDRADPTTPEIERAASHLETATQRIRSALSEGVLTKGDMDVDVFRIVTTEDIADDYDNNLLAVGVDFPNHDVFVDWRIDSWPDGEELNGPHVSVYSTMEDVEDVAQGEIEYVETVDPGDGMSKSPTVYHLDKTPGRRYISDAESFEEAEQMAPDDVEVQEGDQGGYYYEVGDGDSEGGDGSDGGEQQFDPSEIDEYNVATEFGAKVAGATQDGDVVEKVNAYEWQRYAGKIADSNLLVDALQQIEDESGTATAKSRIRQRLRGLGWEEEDISKRIREESGPESSFDVEEGDTVTIEDPINEGTVSVMVERVTDELVDVQFRDTGWEERMTRTKFEDLLVEEDGQDEGSSDFDLDSTIDEMNAGVPIKSFPENIDKVKEISENASTEELKRVVGESIPDDPLAAMEEWYDPDGYRSYNAEFEASDLMEEWNEGEISEEEARERAGEIWEMEPSVFDDSLISGDDRRVVQALLWYREDADLDEDLRDICNFEEIDEDDTDMVNAEQKTWRGFSDAMEKMDPAVGAYAAGTLKKVEYQNMKMAGKHNDLGVIQMDPDGYNVRRTAAHEFGHQVHTQLGLESKNYPENFSSNEPREQHEFGTPEDVIDPEGQEFYDEMRKAFKNWERYQDYEVDEIRPYQRKHGVEYAAVTFAHWATDEAQLQEKDPFAKQMWDVYAGDGEYEDIESADDLQEGDHVVVEGAQGPELIEFTRKEGNYDIMGKPMGLGGRSNGEVPYGQEEIIETRVVRFDD